MDDVGDMRDVAGGGETDARLGDAAVTGVVVIAVVVELGMPCHVVVAG
jgi:hypothetical protein